MLDIFKQILFMSNTWYMYNRSAMYFWHKCNIAHIGFEGIFSIHIHNSFVDRPHLAGNRNVQNCDCYILFFESSTEPGGSGYEKAEKKEKSEKEKKARLKSIKKKHERPPKLNIISVDEDYIVECSFETHKGERVQFKFSVDNDNPDDIVENLVGRYCEILGLKGRYNIGDSKRTLISTV